MKLVKNNSNVNIDWSGKVRIKAGAISEVEESLVKPLIKTYGWLEVVEESGNVKKVAKGSTKTKEVNKTKQSKKKVNEVKKSKNIKG